MSEADLLEAVYASVADDGPREVYADWLLDREDPLGEFIQLQLVGTSPRERQLVGQLQKRVVGELIQKVTKTDREIRRGFLRAVTLKKAPMATFRAAAAAPEWQTVEAIQVAGINVPDGFFNARVFRNVRRLHGAKPAVIRHLVTGPMPLEDLSYTGPYDVIEKLVVDPGNLANLRTLVLETTSRANVLSEIERSPWRHLKRLEVPSDFTQLGAWLRAIDATDITELVLASPIVCTRDTSNLWSIAIPALDWTAFGADALATGLTGVTNVRITVAPTDERYLTYVRRSLAFLGDRVEWRR